MRSLPLRLILLTAVLAASACATPDQWKEWQSHSSHYSSGDHMMFSLRNQGSTPRVSRRDQRLAAAQSWWGDPVVVRAEQIFGD